MLSVTEIPRMVSGNSPCRDGTAQKQRAISLSRSRPLTFPIFEDLGRRPDHNSLSFRQGFGAFEQSPRLPYSSVIRFVARACLSSSRNNQLPGCVAIFGSDSPVVPLPAPLMTLVCSCRRNKCIVVDLKD